MYCFNCGERIGNDYKFCPNCGTEQHRASANDPSLEKAAIQTHHSEEKKQIIKAQKSIINAGQSAAALGWIALFLAPLIYLGLWWNEYLDKPKAIGILIGSYCFIALVIFLGKYVQNVYKVHVLLALWLLLIAMLFAFVSILSLIVAFYLIAALIRLRKLRKTKYFWRSIPLSKKVIFSAKELVAFAIAGVFISGMGIWVATKGPGEISREEMVTNCLSAVSEAEKAQRNYEAYCGCVYDQGVQEQGKDRLTDLLVELEETNKAPTSLQSIINNCSNLL